MNKSKGKDDEEEEDENKGCFGSLSIRIGWFFFGTLDVLMYVAVIVLHQMDILKHEQLIVPFVIFYTPTIFCFFSVIIQDFGTTRKAYYLSICLRLIFMVLLLALFVIHVDNVYLGRLICSKVLKTEVASQNILNMFMAGGPAQPRPSGDMPKTIGVKTEDNMLKLAD